MATNILGPEWNLSPDGINIVTENGALKDEKKVIKNALNCDLKSIGKAVLSHEQSKSRIGKVVLQIQKIRNIAAPKAKENSQAAPRMLKLTLTDGESYIQAIESVPINFISREGTAPGTKVLVNGASIVSSYLLINTQNFSVLGGQVENLHEKWMLAKSVQQSHQYVYNTGAPPWVAFGCKIITDNQEKAFKSLDKNKEGCNENSEFEQQRKEAIAEASSGAVRKTFGGRVKQAVQPAQNFQQYNRGRRPNEKENTEKGRKGKSSVRDEDVVEKLQKPSEKVSLFAFLEDKLPIVETKKTVELTQPTSTRQNYLNRDPRIQSRINRENNQLGSNRQNANDRTSKTEIKTSGTSNASKLESKTVQHLPKPVGNVSQQSSSTSSKPSSTVYNENSYTFNKGSLNNSVESNRTQNNQYNRNNTERNNYQQQQKNQNSYREANRFQNQNHYNTNTTARQQYPSNTTFASPQNNMYYQKPPPNYIQNSNNFQNMQQNAEMHNLATNLSRMSVNNEFASRSLRQALNLGPPKRPEAQGNGPSFLNVGDLCMAKYWEDGKFYEAIVTAITDRTYAVQFTGYGNIEEVLKQDCFSPANQFQRFQAPSNNAYSNVPYSGVSMEFRRRGPPRK